MALLESAVFWNAVAIGLLVLAVVFRGRDSLKKAIDERVAAIATQFNQVSKNLESSRKSLENAEEHIKTTRERCKQIRMLAHEEARSIAQSIEKKGSLKRERWEKMAFDAITRDEQMASKKLLSQTIRSVREVTVNELAKKLEDTSIAEIFFNYSISQIEQLEKKSEQLDQSNLSSSHVK